MFKFLCVLVLLVVVNAAPPYRFKRTPPWCDDDTYSAIPDLGFQANFEDLDPTSVVDSFRNYHQSFNYATYSNDMYKIFIPLGGFTKSEIKVESAGNVVFVEAMHKSLWSYMDYYFEAFAIPDGVNSQGTWELVDGILILEFPLYSINNSPDMVNNPPIATTTEDVRDVLVETNDDTTEESATTTENVSSSTDRIEATAVPMTPEEDIIKVEEITTENIPTTTFETVEKETTQYELIPTSTDITDVKEYSEDEETTTTDEIIVEAFVDENENTTPWTKIPEPAPAQTTVKMDDSDIYFPLFDDSPPAINQKLGENSDFDFYITTSIPLPTELTKEDRINTRSPFVFSFPKIPEIKFNDVNSEEMEIKGVDPKTEYEVFSK